MASHGSIYKILCKTTGKSYVGQTQDTKTKNDVPYNYGVQGRWYDHISSAKQGSTTDFAKAIIAHGADDFIVTTLESSVPVTKLDEREAYWIQQCNSLTPYGYNTMRHSRCKHRESTTLANHYLPTTTKVRLTLVKRNNVHRLVYVYLDQKASPTVRLVFGQAAESSFEEALAEAQSFAALFAEKGIETFEEELGDVLRKYTEKMEQVRGVPISQIRIAKFNHLVALYIKTADGTKRLCFGGKTVTFESAYELANAVKHKILETHTDVVIIDDASEFATGGCL
jgi:hypothetical protein